MTIEMKKIARFEAGLLARRRRRVRRKPPPRREPKARALAIFLLVIGMFYLIGLSTEAITIHVVQPLVTPGAGGLMGGRTGIAGGDDEERLPVPPSQDMAQFPNPVSIAVTARRDDAPVTDPTREIPRGGEATTPDPNRITVTARRDKVLAPDPLPIMVTARRDALTPSDIASIQSALTILRFDPGEVDGVLGRRTEGAVSRWQADHNYPITGQLTSEQREALLAQARAVEREAGERQRAAEQARREEEERQRAADRARREEEERQRAAERARQEAEERQRAAEQARREEEERQRAAEQARQEAEEDQAQREADALADRCAPVRLIVTKNVGGTSDMMARIFAETFNEAISRPGIIVQNILGNFETDDCALIMADESAVSSYSNGRVELTLDGRERSVVVPRGVSEYVIKGWNLLFQKALNDEYFLAVMEEHGIQLAYFGPDSRVR